MFEKLFSGILDSGTASGLTISGYLLCMLTALVIGATLAWVYTYNNSCTKSFVTTLALLPPIVTVVIMMVSGNIGAGVAVAGSFSLVRFRSIPGTAREICAIFIAMAAGLATGMGYIGFALVFSLIIISAWLLYSKCSFGDKKCGICQKTLRITIPEDLDYSGVFDDLFSEYTDEWKLVGVKTTNMGSLYKLTYEISLQDSEDEKRFIDKLRCRNGNLEISSSLRTSGVPEL